ncbi:MAG: hypothetical protein QOD95_1008 [Gammaproteobacteria bacterium]|nr:hypothetical protein [Gammaproteobacteria bacterium]
MSGHLSGIRAAAANGVIGAILAAGLWAAPAPAVEPDVSAASTARAVTANSAEDIRDIRGPKVLLADWVLPAVIAGVAIIALGVYVIWRRRRNRRARVLSSDEIALQRLEEIRTLMQPARAREFSTAASDIVRSYIEQRFDVTATRRTTEEFLRDLLETPHASLARHQSLLGDFLHHCDFVKFAAMSLGVPDMESLRQSARVFVLATAGTEEASPAQGAHDALPTT